LRRTSRVSLNITQGNLQLDRRRSSAASILSSRSTAASPKSIVGGGSASRRVLNAAVKSHKKGVREREMVNKLERLSVTKEGTTPLAAPGTIGSRGRVAKQTKSLV